MTTLPAFLLPEDGDPNPIVKSGKLIYWSVAQDSTGMWASLIGYNGVRRGISPWKVVGISPNKQSAESKARERAKWNN